MTTTQLDTKQDLMRVRPGLGRYAIDAATSTISFRSRHLAGLLPVRGTFAIRAGTVDVAEPLTDSSVQVEIDMASFHTGNARRDDHVRSADFLDVLRHPVMTFASDSINGTTITGTLTACGIARPVRLSVDSHEPSPGAFQVRATTRIDRTEFGVTAARGLAGRYLDVALEVSCVRL